MTIKQIKEQLSILTVLAHYGLSINKIKCSTALSTPTKKQACEFILKPIPFTVLQELVRFENLDVIDLIMKLEDRTSKRQAILKAKSLCGQIEPIKSYTTNYPTMPKPNPSELFKSYQKSLHNHKLAQQYCQNRALSWKQLEVGYKNRKTPDKWGRGCIIFPLLNAKGDILSLYGRGITGSSHFYQTNRSGLYPAYPPAKTKILNPL